MSDPQLLVGLGNPGPNYAQTRHNLGFMVADRLASRLGSNFKVHKRSGAEIVTGRLGGRPVVLAKPRCYMNESGRQVGPLAKFYSVPAADSRGAKTRRRSFWRTSPPPNGRRCLRSASRPPMRPSCLSNWGWSRPKT